MEYNEKFTKAMPLTPALKSKYPAGAYLYLDPDKALQMERDGYIKIVYDDPAEEKKHVLSKLDPMDFFKKAYFEDGNKIKVAWVQDNAILGGAELSNLYCMEIGINCGYDIVTVTPQQFRLQAIKECDVVIINNFYKFSDNQERAIMDFLKKTKTPYVIYSHDMRDLKRMNDRRVMYENSLFNVFISPKHKESYGFSNSRNYIFPLAIDIRKYRIDDSIKREENSVLIPTIKKCGKHVDKFVSENPQYKYYSLGVSKPGMQFVNKTDNNFIYKIYNRFEYVYHCPDVVWAGDRVYFEAKLCGCKVINNDNVGHASWNFEEGDIKEQLSQAPFDFWKTVEEHLEDNCIS